MSISPFSNSWYRVASLRPRLRGHAEVLRHRYRGERWYLVQDHVTGRFHRFTAETYSLIGLMDGQRTLQEIWEIACRNLVDDMPSQDEVIRMLGQLHRADVLQMDLPPDMAEMHRRQDHLKRSRLYAMLRSPLSIKVPLWDPDTFLERTAWIARVLFSPLGWLVWGTAIALALVALGLHWAAITEDLTDRVLATENLVLLWFVYPVVKAIHELGHGYAVKRRGGEVHELGLMFLVFVPVPYVEASASNAFASKYDRMLVGAAGILTELFLAAVALLMWVQVEPGAVRVVAFNVMLICGVSTLLFNGNPLLRFDAYYVLSDFLEIPNLGSKANQQVGYLLRRHLLRQERDTPPARSRREATWLVVYAIASFAYRLFAMLTIALFLAGKMFIVGILLALWSIYGFVVHPMLRALNRLRSDEAIRPLRGRIFAITVGCAGVALLLLFAVPLPRSTLAEGVLWVPGEQRVFAGSNGFVEQVLIEDGQQVASGDLLIRCSNDLVRSREAVVRANLDELRARIEIARSERNIIESQLLEEEVSRVDQQLQRIAEQRDLLQVRSPVSGTFHFLNAHDLPGRYLQRGDELGYVLTPDAHLARVAVSQDDVAAVRDDLVGISVRLAEDVRDEIPAGMVGEVPGAHRELPSLALSVTGGGKFALDPNVSDRPETFAPFFQFEVSLDRPAGFRPGERVYVRFKHSPEAIGFRWIRAARRVLLKQLDY